MNRGDLSINNAMGLRLLGRNPAVAGLAARLVLPHRLRGGQLYWSLFHDYETRMCFKGSWIIIIRLSREYSRSVAVGLECAHKNA